MTRPVSQLATDPDRPTPSDADRVAYFWAMVAVVAKYAVRGWDDRAGQILRGLEEQVDAVDASGPSMRNLPEVMSPLQGLRLLIDRMDRLTPTLGARGIRTPDTSYASAFMSFADDLEQEGLA